MLIVNSCGEHYFIGIDDFKRLVDYDIEPSEPIYLDLKGKHFIGDTTLAPIVDLLATKYRAKKEFLRNFTSLHMVVVTARCNHNCSYCHASSGDLNEKCLDMTQNTAKKVVECIFKTPSPVIKIEFQGGEPLLNFNVVKTIVKCANKYNRKRHKHLEFVIATNLSILEKNHIKFIKKHNIQISTSLDGPKLLHDKCRILSAGDKSSYDEFINKLTLVNTCMPSDPVSSLLTITKHNIGLLKDVVDEYIRLNFNGIFLRALNPYGRASCDEHKLGYTMDEYLKAYKETLSYIIDINLAGRYFVEYNALMFLSKILTPYSTGFVDVQFPSGSGIMGVIYDYNGEVYPTDESRMLARMGDKKFVLGHVEHNSYEEIFGGDKLASLISKTCAEVMPSCCECVFQDCCGVDPIRYYEESGDIVGHRPTSEYCKRNRGIITHLFELLKNNNSDVMDVLWSWITNRSIAQIRRST